MEIKAKIENWVKATTLLSQITLTHPKEIKNGDYAFFAGGQAEEFGQNLVKNRISEIEKVEVVGPFVNLYLTKEFFASKVDEINKAKENFGQTKLLDQQKIIIEYTNTNVLKPLHIGHLMGNVIGQSLSNIFEASGAEIKRNTYQGDVGLHIAKAVWGILKLREKGGNVGETLSEKSNFIGSAYEVGSVNYDLAGIEQEEIKEINKKLYERSDENIMEVYEWGRKVSLDHFEELYKKLNTKFDYYFFESEVANESLKIIEEYFKKGIFEESENAIVFKGEKYDPKLHTRVFVSSQGIPMYEAKDIAHALRKEQKYIADKSIIITANEQDGYFKVVLKALEQINPLVANFNKP